MREQHFGGKTPATDTVPADQSLAEDGAGASEKTQPPVSQVRRILEELALALSLLTRFPLPRFEVHSSGDLRTAFWAYPIAGTAVGAIGGLTCLLAVNSGLNPGVAAILALAAMALSTGGFHEDGLADFWDGLGGGQTRPDKLEIMRDSRLGTYGALALIFAIALAATAVADIVNKGSAISAAGVVVVANALGRLVIVVPLALLSPARAEGLSVAAGRPPAGAIIVAAVITVVVGMCLAGPAVFTAMLAGSAIAIAMVVALASRYLGGYTGDVLGATAFSAMTCAYLAASLALNSAAAV